MASDHPTDKVKRAIVAIVDTDATIASLTGRASGNIAQGFLEVRTAPPVILFQCIGFIQVGEDRDAREGTVQFTIVTDDDDIGGQILKRLEDILTAPNLYTAGIDAAPMLWQDRDFTGGPGSDDDEGPHLRTRNLSVHLADLSLTLTV